MNVLELYIQDGFEPRKASPREWQGPCPGCNGRDRFCIYPDQGSEKAAGMGTFHCGHGRGGNGCGKGGDAIAYLMEFHRLSFKDACCQLGIEAGQPSAAVRYQVPSRPKQHGGALQPITWGWPEDLEHPAIWQEKGLAFVEECHRQLLERKQSIEYLAGRGIDLAAITKYRLGFHPGATRRDQPWQPVFRELSSWGLTPTKQANGRPGVLAIPAGIVIPWITDQGLRRIQIRLAVPDPRNPKKKYHNLRGSCMELWHTGPDMDVQTLIETGLDAIMLDSQAADISGVICLSTVGMHPDSVTHAILERAHTIINALDYDSAAVKPSENWEGWYPHCKRWPVPVGKDPGEAYEQGVDLRAWLTSALPPGLQDRYRADVADGQRDDRAKNFAFADAGGARGIEADDAGVTLSAMDREVLELATLMRRHRAALLINFAGRERGLDFPSPLSNANGPERRRICDIVHRGEFVPGLCDLMPAGRHDAARVARFAGVEVANG